MKELGGNAFTYCWKLTSFFIPADVDTIGEFPLTPTKLTSISVEKGNTHYVSINGVLLDKHKKKLIQYPSGSLNKVYILPAEVTRIGYCAFYGADNLTSVTLPAGLKEIGGWCFMSCGMTSITIPSRVEKIENAPFYDCQKLSNIMVAVDNMHYTSVDGVLLNKAKTVLVQYPNGNKRSTYEIPSRVRTIGYGAFKGSSRLSSIILPSGVTSIEGGAFSGCSGLKYVTVKSKTPPAADESSFGGVKLSEVTLYIPKGSRAAYATAPVWKEFKQITESTVDNALLPESRIYTTDGRLHLSLSRAKTVRIYKVNGVLTRTLNAPVGEISVPLANGVYIVQIDKSVEKVIVN